jgi:hypothetical protein
VTDEKHGGAQSVRLRLRPGGDAQKYGSFLTFFDAAPFVGKRVRASAWLKTKGVTARGDFWVRCQARDSPGDGPGLAGGYANVDTNSDWTEYVAVFDVPKGSVQIDFGVGLSGPGTLWADDAVFEIVPPKTPLRSGAPERPRNLDFSR